MTIARLGPVLAVLLLAGPIVFGLAGTLLPAFGYLPAIGGTALGLQPFAMLFAKPGIVMSASISLAAGVVTAGISLVLVMLFVAAWAATPAFKRVQHAISPLLSVPHAAAAFGFAFLVAPSGMISRLVSPWLTGWMDPPDWLIVHDPMGLSMMAGLVVKEMPFLLLVTLAALPQVRIAQTRQLAAALGYGRIAGFAFVAWPVIYRQIRLAVFAVIAFASSVVDVAAILGPTTPAPLAVRLVVWMNDPELQSRFLASAGAVLQFGVTALALGIWIALERIGSTVAQFACERGWRMRRDAAMRRLALGAVLLSAAIVFAGLAVLALWSFAGLWSFPDALPRQFTLRSWMRAAPQIATPLATTLLTAVLSTALATVLVILYLVREDEVRRPSSRLLALIYLPLIVPQASFLFGLQLLIIGARADASLGALVFAHLVFVMPYVFLSLADPWRAFDRRYEAVAAGLGAGRWRILFAVRLPMLARAILTAAAVGFAVSIGQYLPTVLIGAGRLTTVTTEAVALASGGNRRVIGVYAFVQMLLPVLGFLVATAVPAFAFRHRRAMRV